MNSAQQGTDAWKQARVGKLTASRISALYSGKATYRRIKKEIAWERIKNEPTEFFINDAMLWGTETEPLARAAYEFAKDLEVEQVGLIDHPAIEGFGCSPDGLVGDDGQIEIKCPNTNTHLTYIQENKPPKKYIPQIQAQLAVTGRQWCDFISFDPRVNEDIQLFIVRVQRDDDYIVDMEQRVRSFIVNVERLVERYERMKYVC